MSGLFSWATDAIASVTSSVIAPFRGGASPVTTVPETHVTGKQSFRKQGNAKAKKRAQAKRRAQISAKMSSLEEKDGDHDDGEESSTSAPTVPTVASANYEPDEATKVILAKMAEAAERRAQEEKEAEEAEAQRIREREELLRNSIVKDMPSDALAEERAAAKKEILERLAKIGSCDELLTKFEEFQQVIQTKHRELDEVVVSIEAHLRAIARKCPRVAQDKMNLEPEELREMIQEEELKESPNDLEIKNLYNALVGLICQRNQKVFFSEMQDLINSVSSQRSRMVANFEKARTEDFRQRAIDRLVVLYEGLEGSPTLKKADVVGKSMDLPCDWNKLMPFSRKIEKRFRCIISPPRQRSGSARIVQARVWGYEEDCDELIEWVKKSDWKGTDTRTYDKRLAGAIIGRNGSTIQQIEQETGTLLNLDGSNTLTAYGLPEDIEKVWQKVDALKVEQRSAPVQRGVNIDARIGRAIIAYHRSKVQALEDQFQCRINFSLQPEEGEPRVVVRCPADKQDEVLAEIQKSLINNYTVLDFHSSAKAVSRLLIPQRLPGRAAQVNAEFKSFQTDLDLFVQRDQQGNDASEVSGMWVVCAKKDSELVKTTIDNLLKKADYSTERISIMREQQRIFTAENRGLIEASSGCKVSIVNNPNEGTFLMLIGSEDCIEKGREIVRDILEREGAVVVAQLGGDGSAVMDYLLRDRAAILRSMEDLHAVSIHIDREKNTARIVGDRNAIEAAHAEIQDIEKEIARSQEDTVRLVVTVDSDKVPMLIGRGGSTIQQIRNIPGVQSIDVPNRADIEDTSTEIVLVGRTAALEEAQAFIESIVNRSQQMDSPSGAPSGEAVDYGERFGGRGRGRRSGARQAGGMGKAATGTEGRTHSATASGPLQFEDSAFPALEEGFTGLVEDA